LADNSQETSAPKVSKLPLPVSDSPLVIDLPDGQKIVVGKMSTGSVIEVATWRGVGRPDSRTSRLMLGVGTGNVNEDAQASTSTPAHQQPPAPAKPKGFAAFMAMAKDIIQNYDKINWKATFRALIQSKMPKKKTKATPVVAAPEIAEKKIEPTVSIHPVSEDSEIEEWLNRISEKATKTSARAAQKSAPKKATPAKKASVTKKAAPKSTNTRDKRK
jgi:hypothetical protein